MVTKLASKDEFNKVLSEGTVLVDFFATWCGPCVAIAPALEKLAGEFVGSVKFCKVDVDELGELAEEQGISCMPTFKIYKGGKEVGQLQGASEQGIRSLVEKHK